MPSWRQMDEQLCGVNGVSHSWQSHSWEIRTFVVEPVDSVDTRAFVVPAEDEEVLGILDLVCEKEADRLETLFPAIHVVAEEEVVRLGREAAVLEQPEQVVVLPVNVT